MVLVAVIGAGVVGLTTAIKIQELGYDVVVIAELLPGDEKSIRYTSNWAGANHMSMAGDDKRQLELDKETFDVMWKMSEPGAATENLFMRVPTSLYYEEKGPQPEILEFMPKFRPLSKDELRVGSVEGVTFETVTIDVWRYLAYLYSQVLLRGGRVVRAQVQHISQVLTGAYSAVPDALVICTGLGARTLGGVEDKLVHPIRGQTVLIRAPWVKFSMTASGIRKNIETYIIPRPNGDVILGGTFWEDDWYPKPLQEVHEAIMEAILELAPEIAPPNILAAGKQPTVADLESLVIERGCGLRPGRTGGIRLEREIIEGIPGKKVPVVYNYGHGGQGYQSSWGSASFAVTLLSEGLREVEEVKP